MGAVRSQVALLERAVGQLEFKLDTIPEEIEVIVAALAPFYPRDAIEAAAIATGRAGPDAAFAWLDGEDAIEAVDSVLARAADSDDDDDDDAPPAGAFAAFAPAPTPSTVRWKRVAATPRS